MQDAFAAMMANPGQPDLALRYAQLAAAQGDARAAIAALERVLRINPSLDNIRLELASLHLAAGSPDLAAAYAREALSSPNIPPDVAQRARLLMARAERGAARSTLDVRLNAGLRYDSNANEATALRSVPVFVPVLQDVAAVPTAVRGRSDWSLVLGASAEHRYDLGLQRNGSWDTNAALYEQRFARIPRGYDLSIATLDTGPRFDVADGDSARLTLRPFVTASWIGYGGETYTWLYGGGLTAQLALARNWSVELTWLGRFGNYENSNFRPRAREITGAEQIMTAGLFYALSSQTRMSAAVSYTDADAREPWWARSGLGAALAVSSVLPISTSLEVGTSARLGVRRLRFDAPDPFIDPTQSRRDTRWEAGASLQLPVAPSVMLTLDYEWYEQNSNYGFYEYGNHAVMLGVRVLL
ncbi:surface lipoprotein assembly modifier [Teichococcus coralli]|nr:surface lipoprotein assembly modifier [Pseudoroseomonas coralli]